MVIFSDFSDVLACGYTGFFEALEKKFGITRAEIEPIWEAGHEAFWEVLRDKADEDEFWELMAKGNRHGVTGEDIRDVFHENFKNAIPGTLDVYRRIVGHPKNLVLERSVIIPGRPEIYITSDHLTSLVPKLYEWHPEVFELTNGEYWSCNLEMTKTDDEFFPQVLDTLDVSASETLFIDDDPRNIAAARRHGITGIQFVGAERLEKTLAEVYGLQFAPKNEENAP